MNHDELSPEQLEMRQKLFDQANEARSYRLVMERKGESYDSDDVRWTDAKGESRGYGFIGKKKDKKIALMRCPACNRENYAMNVSSGMCTWCPFDSNNVSEPYADTIE